MSYFPSFLPINAYADKILDIFYTDCVEALALGKVLSSVIFCVHEKKENDHRSREKTNITQVVKFFYRVLGSYIYNRLIL